MPSWHRVVSELARVPVSGTLLVATDDFADRRIDIDHQAAGRGDTRPRGALERFAVNTFELADVTERERPQERPDRRWCHHPMTEHTGGRAGASCRNG